MLEGYGSELLHKSGDVMKAVTQRKQNRKQWDPAPRLLKDDGILRRSATAEARVGQINTTRHVGVEIEIGYSLNEKARGTAGVNITVRLNNFTADPEGGESVFASDKQAFGDFLDVRDLEPFAIALTEAVRLARLDGTIQPWMVSD